MKIKGISAREILDSRGNPTVEAKVVLENGVFGIAKVPSGASTGSHEALELRDGGRRYGGKGVLKAIKNIEKYIFPALKGKNVLDQRSIDQIMIRLDGTKNKSKLGANAILGVSLAAARAGAVVANQTLYAYIRSLHGLDSEAYRLPFLTMNILNGGEHARNNLSIQEFMIIPVHKLLHERVRIGSEIFHTLQNLLIEKKYFVGVGDEGGFSPNIPNGLKDNEKALQLIMQAIREAGYRAGKDVFLGLDLAASEFYKNGNYYFVDKSHPWKAKKIIDTLLSWTKKYPLISLEDPLAEDDWENWQDLTTMLGENSCIVGDDLFVTQKERLSRGIEEGVANTILIKLNQVGTLTETLETISLARKNNYKISVSHRSGETADTFIADLGVAVNAEFIKTGSLSRSERVEKYNRLMEIEKELQN
jgi:enolase